jgi:GT2 family glycosyltransferase
VDTHTPNSPGVRVCSCGRVELNEGARLSHSTPAEVIAKVDGAVEAMALDSFGNIVHGVPHRGGPGSLALKRYELGALWTREVTNGSSGGACPYHDGAPAEQAPLPSKPVGSVEVVCCTYNRIAEPIATIEQLLRDADGATNSGIAVTVRVLFQNAGFPESLYERKPAWRNHPALRLTPSLPPGLPRARNVGLGASAADLVVFVDDDVEIEPGFVLAHVRAANANPEAIGIAGRIRSRVMGADRVNRSLAVGQIHLSGRVDDNFDSVGQPGVTVVVHTPRGANMAFRREALLREMGPRPFDESLPGSAHREETTLAIELFRRGHYIVFAPEASLLHLEAESGGCENRGPLTVHKRLDHLALDYLFLNRLYAPKPLLRTFAPLLQGVREVREAKGIARKLFRAGLNLAAYRKGRQLYAKRQA